MSKADAGRRGEEIAKNHLIALGWKHLASNFRSRAGEIDLIMMDGKDLVLVEVKLRINNHFEDIEKTIDKGKINKILKTAEIYINKYDVKFSEMRIDAFFIEELDGILFINHNKNFY